MDETAATREAAIAWREEAMRAQYQGVAPGAKIPLLRARPGPFHFRACRRCGAVGQPLADTCGACEGPVLPLCYSCGEPTRFPGGRCDLCFAAAQRVVPTHRLAAMKGTVEPAQRTKFE